MPKPYQPKKNRKAWAHQPVIRPIWVLEMYYAGRCHYCGAEIDKDHTTIDHMTPKVKGGKTIPSNCCPACYECNQLKGDADYGDFIVARQIVNSCGGL